ncbi:D-alanine--D-alanine ligase family protein [Otoolea muris]|uniref:D-alanine--D-alanine ligase family protein n=1 Tax=Otoolea muris TaxID=2941515 RepID=UPI00203B5DC8|nr:D-alanine--D-alanine ligase family protein [Otoolea muris]
MKKKVLVIFGGQSSEHIVSCMSAVNVINQIDRVAYDVVLTGITEEGKWLLVDSASRIEDETWRQGTVRAALSPDAVDHGLLITDGEHTRKERVDVVFPVLHGLYGEDGTIQGLCELARIPYVGCGVLASAVSMDKLYTKIIADRLGICQAAYEPVDRGELSDMDSVVRRIEARFPYPVFIKPSNAGSSRGVSRAKDREALKAGLLEAARHDRKLLVEEEIRGHEVECAVFGGGAEPALASGVGEILAGADFYDFDAKYFNAESKTVLDPKLPEGSAEEVRKAAAAVFAAVDGYGLSRVDFFVTEEGRVVFNEINTMPGFTAISMYPMLFEAAGISRTDLVTRLIEHGLKRFDA